VEGFGKFTQLVMIVFFAGSVVSVAARDVRAGLEHQGPEKQVQVDSLIRQLHGEVLLKKGEAVVHPDVLPLRKPGRLLTERDRRACRAILKHFVRVSEDPPQ
jgi:hypothetical protein